MKYLHRFKYLLEWLHKTEITETNSTGSLISSSSTATTAYENSTDCVIYKASFVSGTGNCQTFSDGTANKTLTACTTTVGSGGYTINANGSCRVSFLIQ